MIISNWKDELSYYKFKSFTITPIEGYKWLLTLEVDESDGYVPTYSFDSLDDLTKAMKENING